MKEESKSTSHRFTKPFLLNIHIDDPSAHHLLMFLCVAAWNGTGESFHGHASIAYATGLSKKTIQRATRKLEHLGVISCEVRGTLSSDVNETNLYTVHHDKLLELAEQGKAGREPFIKARVLARREHDATRQRRRRSRQESLVTDNLTVTEDACHGQISAVSRTMCPDVTDNLSECHGHSDPLTTNRTTNRSTNRTTKEQEPVSGEREKFGMTVDELATEVARLKQLKQQAIHDCQPTYYSALTVQLRERQQELNVVRGMAYKKAMPTRSTASVNS